jgi:DNA-binding beta-propeller fold protein YncE
VNGYRIDAMTGDLFALAGFPVFPTATAYSLTVDPSNHFLYVGNSSAASVSGYLLDGATGGLTAMASSPFPAGNLPQFIAIP